MSVKKLLCNFLMRFRLLLKLLTVCTKTHSSSREFHRLTTRSEKKNFRRSVWQWCFLSFSGCPRVLVSLARSNRMSALTPDSPLTILNISMRSARFLRSSRVHKLRASSLVLYSSCFNPGIILVKRCWTSSGYKPLVRHPTSPTTQFTDSEFT